MTDTPAPTYTLHKVSTPGWTKGFASADAACAELLTHICDDCLNGVERYVGAAPEYTSPPDRTSIAALLGTSCGCEYEIASDEDHRPVRLPQGGQSDSLSDGVPSRSNLTSAGWQKADTFSDAPAPTKVTDAMVAAARGHLTLSQCQKDGAPFDIWDSTIKGMLAAAISEREKVKPVEGGSWRINMLRVALSTAETLSRDGSRENAHELLNSIAKNVRHALDRDTAHPDAQGKVTEDTRRLDWLQEQTVDTIYLDDGRIIDVRGGDLRAALTAALEG